MLFRVLTIFPDLINQYFMTGVLGRAQKKKIITVTADDIRSWSSDARGTVDDTPYGGGAGMVMKAEPIIKALRSLRAKSKFKKSKQVVILLSARGRRWNQSLAHKYKKKYQSLIFICGRYEGIDERVMEFVDEEISLGDFVITGGEAAAITIIDSIARLLPGVLGNTDSLTMESHAVEGILEYPQYTKPEIISLGKKKLKVPAVLLSGNHQAVAEWRKKHLKKVKKINSRKRS